jgi:hypothetical protein
MTLRFGAPLKNSQGAYLVISWRLFNKLGQISERELNDGTRSKYLFYKRPA